MKVIETLTPQQIERLMVDRVSVGIFPDMIFQTDPYYSLSDELCVGYYLGHSANKTLSPLYMRLRELALEHPNSDDIDQIVGNIIRERFSSKWSKVYDLLITKEYDALNNIDITETKTGNNTDVTTYDTNIEDNGEVGTHEVTTTSEENSDDVYGFNSQSPVPDSYSTGNMSETVVGDKDKNTSHNIQAKTGTESKAFGIDESTIKRGRWYGDPTEAITKEIEMRIKFNFFDAVYRDIDSVLTCPMYE